MKKLLLGIVLTGIIGLVVLLKPLKSFKQAQLSSTSSQNTSKNTSILPRISESMRYSITPLVSTGGKVRDLEITPGDTLLFSRVDSNTISAILANHEVKTIISGSNLLHGIVYHNGKLFVAETEKVSRYAWHEESKTATFEKDILTLPSGSLHTYRTLIFDPEGRLFISIGADCNVCEVIDPWQGAILVTDENGSNPEVFAKGLRNAPFMAIHPQTTEIWATEMGRDYLGDELPPDEIDIIRKDEDYGFPKCYGNKVHDSQFDKKQYIQDPCKNTVAPIFDIPAHSAPLGLAFIPEDFNPDWKGDLLVAYHGSWNRSTKTGYKVVHVTVNGNTITRAEDFITGFYDGNSVYARPVDLLFDHKGTLYISDDESGRIFQVKRERNK